MENYDVTNMSLDDIIWESGYSRSHSCRPYRGQQWRLERGRQQQLIDNQHPRFRSRSQASYRSGSQILTQFSVPCTPPRCRSLPRQTNSFCNQWLASAQRFRLRNGSGANIRKHSLGFSASSASALRTATSLQQLRLAKKRVEVAKKILNARHQLYLKQLRQYRHEILENSFVMPQYRLRNTQEFPVLRDCNKISHHLGGKQVHTDSYSQGLLSVTFKNELANSRNGTYTAEDYAVPMGSRTSEALNSPPQMLINGCVIRNPSVGTFANSEGVCVSPQEHVIETDSLPNLVSSSDSPRLIYKPNGPYMDDKMIVHPVNTVQKLNQRFSAYRVAWME